MAWIVEFHGLEDRYGPKRVTLVGPPERRIARDGHPVLVFATRHPDGGTVYLTRREDAADPNYRADGAVLMGRALEEGELLGAEVLAGLAGRVVWAEIARSGTYEYVRRLIGDEMPEDAEVAHSGPQGSSARPSPSTQA